LSCPICRKRKLERYCPAKGEKICAVCCGTEREVSIDCPADCAYLVAAHRYEDEHHKAIPPGEAPFPDVQFSADLIHEHRPTVSSLAFAILNFAAEQPALADADALEALAALAETYRTLGSGIYYEKPPAAALPRELYGALGKFLQEFGQPGSAGANFPRPKESELFLLLVFLLRVGRNRTNGRPRTRRFLEFLRAQFPQAAAQREAPRIIVP